MGRPQDAIMSLPSWNNGAVSYVSRDYVKMPDELESRNYCFGLWQERCCSPTERGVTKIDNLIYCKDIEPCSTNNSVEHLLARVHSAFFEGTRPEHTVKQGILPKLKCIKNKVLNNVETKWLNLIGKNRLIELSQKDLTKVYKAISLFC